MNPRSLKWTIRRKASQCQVNMSVRRLSNIDAIPHEIRRAFRNSFEPREWEETLWREVAARMTLDALGYTGLTGEPEKHDAAVREARRWFKGIPELDSPVIVFDYAVMSGYFHVVRDEVLKYPITYMLDEDDFEEFVDDDDIRAVEIIDPEFLGGSSD